MLAQKCIHLLSRRALAPVLLSRRALARFSLAEGR